MCSVVKHIGTLTHAGDSSSVGVWQEWKSECYLGNSVRSCLKTKKACRCSLEWTPVFKCIMVHRFIPLNCGLSMSWQKNISSQTSKALVLLFKKSGSGGSWSAARPMLWTSIALGHLGSRRTSADEEGKICLHLTCSPLLALPPDHFQSEQQHYQFLLGVWNLCTEHVVHVKFLLLTRINIWYEL